MRILVLTHLYPPHHAGTYDLRCQEVVDALALRGHAILVLTSNHGLNTEQCDGEIHRRLHLNNVFGHAAAAGYRELERLETHNHSALRDAVAAFQPDLAYVWSLHGLSKSLLFALGQLRLPVVYDMGDRWLPEELHEDPWLRWWNAPGTNLMRSGLELAGQRNRLDAAAPTRMMPGIDRLPDVFGPGRKNAEPAPDSVSSFSFQRLYFCSRALKEASRRAGYRVGHGDVIYPGIPTESFVGDVKPLSAPVRKFLVVSALDDRSGVMTAAEALLRARQNKSQAVLSVYGRGDSGYVSALRSFVVRNALPVEFLTVSNQNRDLAGVYRQHDALIYTAEWDEPFATRPLEAMACGLPVIGARSGGAQELFRHGENALTYGPGDAADLAARLQELQMQPALRRQMAETAQAEIQSGYNQATVIDQVEAYLNATLEIWQQS